MKKKRFSDRAVGHDRDQQHHTSRRESVEEFLARGKRITIVASPNVPEPEQLPRVKMAGRPLSLVPWR